MARDNGCSSVIPTYTQLCASSHYSNIKQPALTNFPPFLSPPLQNIRHVAPTGSSLAATLFQLLHNNVPLAILFAAMHEKRAIVRATMDHAEVLDAGAQQEVEEEERS